MPAIWLFRQWFAENADEELLVLKAFSDALRPEHVMIDYNGTTFDLPFLRDRYRFHKLPCPRPDKSETVDLFRHLSPVKALFGNPNKKQPTLELTAGYHRTDPYDGGTLIAVAFEGDEYVTELNEDLHHPVDEDDIFLNINDLMFYYIEKGEVYWLPRTPEQMFGKKLNFAKYSIQLPREGKTITFTDRNTEKVAATYTWNGSRFVEGR